MDLRLLKQTAKHYTQIGMHRLGWHVSKYSLVKNETNLEVIARRLLGDPAAPTLFDVGAYVGLKTRDFLEAFPAAKVHVFEPFPESFEQLSKNFQRDAGVKLQPMAMSDSVGTATFHSNNIVTTNSLLASAETDSKDDYFRETKGTLTVNTTTLDHYCETEQIDRIDLLKMDIQGGELSAFKGATRLLNSHAIKLIYCEVLFTKQYENTPLYHDLATYLDQYNYRLFNFYDLSINEHGELAYADALFYSPELQSEVREK